MRYVVSFLIIGFIGSLLTVGLLSSRQPTNLTDDELQIVIPSISGQIPVYDNLHNLASWIVVADNNKGWTYARVD